MAKISSESGARWSERDLERVWHAMSGRDRKAPTMVVEGANGSWVTDTYGNRYLDGMAGQWCVNVGYGREELSGHLDGVPVGPEERGRWSLDPSGAKVVDGELWGRGSVDMKGGLSSAVAAVAALRRAEVDLPGDLWLLASADEEIWMRGAKRIASDFSRGKAPASVGAAVICEPTNLRVAHVCMGRTWATLRVLGQTAHASLRGAGVNAVAHAARLATLLEGITPRHEPHELTGESW